MNSLWAISPPMWQFLSKKLKEEVVAEGVAVAKMQIINKFKKSNEKVRSIILIYCNNFLSNYVLFNLNKQSAVRKKSLSLPNSSENQLLAVLLFLWLHTPINQNLFPFPKWKHLNFIRRECLLSNRYLNFTLWVVTILLFDLSLL